MSEMRHTLLFFALCLIEACGSPPDFTVGDNPRLGRPIELVADAEGEWSIVAAPADAAPQLSASGASATLVLDREGVYTVELNADGGAVRKDVSVTLNGLILQSHQDPALSLAGPHRAIEHASSYPPYYYNGFRMNDVVVAWSDNIQGASDNELPTTVYFRGTGETRRIPGHIAEVTGKHILVDVPREDGLLDLKMFSLAALDSAPIEITTFDSHDWISVVGELGNDLYLLSESGEVYRFNTAANLLELLAEDVEVSSDDENVIVGTSHVYWARSGDLWMYSPEQGAKVVTTLDGYPVCARPGENGDEYLYWRLEFGVKQLRRTKITAAGGSSGNDLELALTDSNEELNNRILECDGRYLVYRDKHNSERLRSLVASEDVATLNNMPSGNYTYRFADTFLLYANSADGKLRIFDFALQTRKIVATAPASYLQFGGFAVWRDSFVWPAVSSLFTFNDGADAGGDVVLSSDRGDTIETLYRETDPAADLSMRDVLLLADAGGHADLAQQRIDSAIASGAGVVAVTDQHGVFGPAEIVTCQAVALTAAGAEHPVLQGIDAATLLDNQWNYAADVESGAWAQPNLSVLARVGAGESCGSDAGKPLISIIEGSGPPVVIIAGPQWGRFTESMKLLVERATLYAARARKLH